MTIPDQKNTIDPNNDHPLANIVFSFIVPSIILSKLSDHERLGPETALLLAIAFPLSFAIYQFWKFKKASFISILGFISTALTGGFGLMELSGIWFAAKEATVPGVIALLLILSARGAKPLVKTFLYNDKVIHVDLVQKKLEDKSNVAGFEKHLYVTTWMLAGSFVLSAILNFSLAIAILKSPAGTPEFNQELGQMTALSYPVIVIPSMVCTFGALWWLLSGIKRLTGLKIDEIFRST